jgi:hypothetical protein
MILRISYNSAECFFLQSNQKLSNRQRLHKKDSD